MNQKSSYPTPNTYDLTPIAYSLSPVTYHTLTLSLLFPLILFASALFSLCLKTVPANAGVWDERAASATGGGVSNNAGTSRKPSLALDTNGNPHIAWDDFSANDMEIYYAYWDGANWVTHGGAIANGANAGGGLSNNAGDSIEPSLALDTNGNPHIAWYDNSGGNWEIYYAYWDGANWVTHGGANTGGGVSNDAGGSGNPSLALDTNGNPHIAWHDFLGGVDLEIYYAYWDGANWVTHGGANTGGGVSNNAGDSTEVSLALDTNGNPHIAWHDYSGGGWEIYYAYWDGDSWETYGGANTGGGASNTAGDSSWASLALDTNGNPHIAWYDISGGNAEIYYAYWDGANWVTHGGANTGGGASNTAGVSLFSSLALDTNGNPHIAWDDSSGGGDWEIYYAYWDGANWVTHGGANTGGGVSNNAGETYWPFLALDTNGNPHIAWNDYSGGNAEIYYRYWNPLGGTTTTTTTSTTTTTTTSTTTTTEPTTTTTTTTTIPTTTTTTTSSTTTTTIPGTGAIDAVQAVQGCQTQIASLSPTVFKNPNMQNALLNKLNAVIANIEAGLYADALGQLQNDILGKTDGCANAGAPDMNDWIKDCATQGIVHPCLLDAIAKVGALIP